MNCPKPNCNGRMKSMSGIMSDTDGGYVVICEECLASFERDNKTGKVEEIDFFSPMSQIVGKTVDELKEEYRELDMLLLPYEE